MAFFVVVGKGRLSSLVERFWNKKGCSLFLYRTKQIDSMLPCVCLVMNHRRRQNVVRNISDTLGYRRVPLSLFLPHFDVDHLWSITEQTHGNMELFVTVRFTNFWQTVSEVRLKILKFAANLAVSLRTCQSNCELENNVVNFTPNFVGKLTSSLRRKFAPFGEIVSEFL